jgi:uncharacterized membrane-anchored protein
MTTAARAPLPLDHAQRVELNDEVHARPPEALLRPVRLLYLALIDETRGSDADWRAVATLTAQHGIAPPPAGTNHFRLDVGTWRLKWERHGEFSRYMLIVPGAFGDPFSDDGIDASLRAWLTALPGRTIAATRVAIAPAPETPLDTDALAARHFDGNVLVGGAIGGGDASAYTDFRVHPDGMSRLLVHDRSMTPRRAGRMTQRLLEIDTYRMLALLALPVAREVGRFLATAEQDLAAITREMSSVEAPDEPALLLRLTRLEAELERRQADSQFRFGAANAYDELVSQRIAELRETGQAGLQTFREFTERRFAPAMATCRSTAARLEALSRRVGRTSQLLSARIEITRESQNQQLLESMDRRAELQLHLQSTVEGLSVAAITYYVVGLVAYLAKGLKGMGLPLNPDIATAIAIPVVAVFVALGVRRIRKLIS